MTSVPDQPLPRADNDAEPTASSDRPSRRRKLVLGAAGLFLLLAALGILAIPLLSVPADARSAEQDLSAALQEMQQGDVPAAREHVEQARKRIDDAQHSVQGVGGDVWSRIPLIGTPVADARHLVQALDDAAAVAKIGVELYPSVTGKRATLFRDQKIDRETLEKVIEGARVAGAHLLSADRALDAVRGTTPFIGDTIAAKRDQAAARVAPAAEAFTDLEPILDELPGFFGFDGARRYLIAMLNPAELRYSGGAALAFAPMSWDAGELEMGRAFSLTDDSRLTVAHTWRKVRGNKFHRNDTRLANSTFAPSWSISGEELLRAWRSATGRRFDGVLAVDVVTMAKLLDATGPTSVPGVGELTGDNVVETLVGSYDDYYPDPTVQDQTLAGVVAALQQRLFDGGEYVVKGRALEDAADGRHLALYMRDDDVQAALSALGLDGDLTEPVGDYVGVFTQSLVGAKVDYYQRRSIDLEVSLSRDGSASNQLDVLLHNDTPPYAVPGVDPHEGYFTRWSDLAASVFLPGTASVERFSLDGQPWNGHAKPFYDHSYVVGQTTLPPGGSTHLRASYRVPDAAAAGESGDLTYRLAMDPQGTVIPASAQVTVQLPEGYQAASLPDGWSAQGNTLTFQTDALDTSETWEIPLEAGT